MTAEGPARKSSAHVPELDGVRGIAIAAVMALHFVCSTITPQNTLESLLSKATSYGVWGVDLFFVLSGYLITGILYDTRSSPRYFRSFYARRTLRIFPLYYGILFVLFVLTPDPWLDAVAPGLLEAQRAQAWLWTYLTNVLLARDGSYSLPYLSHFWSLAVEEHFYLFWPFIIHRLSRTAAMRTCVALGVGALVLRLALHASGTNAVAIQVLTPCRLDTLCTGAWFALAARGPAASAVRAPRAWFGGTAAAVLAVSVVYASSALGFLLAVRESLLALFFGFFIVNAVDERTPARLRGWFKWRWLTALGKYSYGLYVFHGILAHALLQHKALERLEHWLGSRGLAFALHTLLGVGLSLVVAVVSYELFEARLLRLKRWFEPYAPAQAVARVREAESKSS